MPHENNKLWKLTVFETLTGYPRSGKKSGKKKHFFKVRELSGNFEICQGILKFKQK